ncbi:hypothetical protein GF340_04690 [Candidatus Peregrinibacteria bacterium]|nr:hypothetical protein [Candidatus Peregrinibacteria bacterium]
MRNKALGLRETDEQKPKRTGKDSGIRLIGSETDPVEAYAAIEGTDGPISLRGSDVGKFTELVRDDIERTLPLVSSDQAVEEDEDEDVPSAREIADTIPNLHPDQDKIDEDARKITDPYEPFKTEACPPPVTDEELAFFEKMKKRG